jgi:hypothetical protein
VDFDYVGKLKNIFHPEASPLQAVETNYRIYLAKMTSSAEVCQNLMAKDS